jgi:hypothetical protein
MIKAYSPSTRPYSPTIRESSLVCQSPKAPRPVKRIHEIASCIQAMESLNDKVKQDNTKCELLFKTSDKPSNLYRSLQKFPKRQMINSLFIGAAHEKDTS